MNEKSSIIECDVAEAEAGMRLDVFLAGRIEDASRSVIQAVIKDGGVRVNGQVVSRSARALASGDRVAIALPPAPTTTLEPEDIPLDVLYEDEQILVLNKASGLVVHPAPGHYTGTLVNAVLYHCRNFQEPSGQDDPAAASRPGIVHRLDRYTSGVMVVAKTQKAFDSLSTQAREHTFDRKYIALVRGEFDEDSGVIRASIGRSTADRTRMAITSVNAREAVTRFRTLERYGVASLVELKLETGRTHQIRVHLRFAGRPVLGDAVYGVTDFEGWNVPADVRTGLEALDGQALHAELLGLTHPTTGERMTFTAQPPHDFEAARKALAALQA